MKSLFKLRKRKKKSSNPQKFPPGTSGCAAALHDCNKELKKKKEQRKNEQKKEEKNIFY